MKGRKPAPSALKKARGTDQPVRMNNQAIEPGKLSKMPPAPKWFSKTAKAIYKQKSDELIAQGVMSTLDIDMFILYCHEYATYIETSEVLTKIPYTDALSEASEKVHKRLTQQNSKAWERSKSIAIEFGFTPSSRARVPKATDQDFEDDDFS